MSFRTCSAVLAFSTLSLMTLLNACASHRLEPPAQRALTRLPLETCTVSGVEEELLCGRLEVPEDRSRLSGRTIFLNVVVVPATAPHPRRDPYVELLGSPGFAATRMARAYSDRISFMRRDRDVLLVDQRGTGGSNPLACAGVSGPSELRPRWPEAAVAACRDQLSEIADLTKYTTADAADDLDAVRAWLGYDQINVFGGSYGSRAALEYMRRYPNRVRSAILFGLVPPHFRRPLYYARDAQHGMNLLLEDCAQDEQCSAAFPATREQLASILERLESDPVQVTFAHPETQVPLQGTIDAFTFSTVVWEALMAPTSARQLPLIIDRAASGDFELFLKVAIPSAPSPVPYYDGMHLSVTCPDETLHIDTSEVDLEHQGMFMPSDRVALHLRACRLWGMERSSPAVLEPVRAEVPTLLITAYMDPVTPLRWADEVARHLSNSRQIVIRHMSHTIDNDCVDHLAAMFVTDVNLEMDVHSCVAELRPPPFALEP